MFLKLSLILTVICRLLIMFIEECAEAVSGRLKSSLYRCSQKRLQADALRGRYQHNSERSQHGKGCLCIVFNSNWVSS